MTGRQFSLTADVEYIERVDRCLDAGLDLADARKRAAAELAEERYVATCSPRVAEEAANQATAVMSTVELIALVSTRTT